MIRTATMPLTDAELLQRLEQFTAAFRGDFRRADQARWAAVYLLGLLRAEQRKSIESLARTLSLPPQWGVKDIAQALQHFINQSPWDEQKIWNRYLTLAARELVPADGVFVVSELTFVKQGRHSVGVQRQFSSALGHKTNCQLAVALHAASPSSFVPLSLRLYLPRGWLQDTDRLDVAGVPAARRKPADKTTLALELLDQALAAGVSGRGVALVPSKGIGDDFARGVTERGLDFVREMPSELGASVEQGARLLQEELGLDHFEGRSWRGFHHHACLVILAHGFLERLGSL
ncbi:MAG: transposase [Planctomycetes bacterium]|nr:transposase [Planctomycetota bacterium]